MKRVLLLAVLVVFAGGGLAFYLAMSKAGRDTEAITTLKEEKLSADKLAKLTEEKAASFKEAQQAAEQAREMSLGEQFELWKTQLGHDSASVQLKAVTGLIELEAKQHKGAAELLKEVALDKKYGRDLRTAVQRQWAFKKLEGREGAARVEAARGLLTNALPGFRLVALEIMAEARTPENDALMRKLLESEKDEDVVMMTRMILGIEDDEEEDDEGEEEEEREDEEEE